MITEGFGTGWPRLDLIRLFFSILKLVSFKKLNGTGRDENGKIPKPAHFTFDFCFVFIFFIVIILKLIYFIKNKKI